MHNPRIFDYLAIAEFYPKHPMADRSLHPLCYPLTLTDGKVCPIDCLDHVMYKGDSEPHIEYYCPYTGKRLNKDTYRLAIEQAKDKTYASIDHVFIMLVVNSVKFLYVSLDNSAWCEARGLSLADSGRLTNICILIAKINPDVLFVSEACRKTVDAEGNVVYWPQLRQRIAEMTRMCQQSRS